MNSIWPQAAQLPPFPPLRSDLKTDVLIIGGGMAGLLCAYKLSQAGVDCALVEANRIGSGVTKNTTAKITAQHGLIYASLIQRLGIQRTKLYLSANQAALAEYRALCRDIDCGFEERDAFVYSVNSGKRLEQELSALDRLGFAAEFVESLPLPFPTAGAVKFPRQAQFHPLKFIAAIAKGLRIFEHTKVLELGPGWASTGGGRISADRIIVATHFPLLNKHGCYFLKLYQHRSYVLALKNAPDVHGMYLDENQRGGGWSELERFVQRHYPKAQETARWATQDCMTLDGVPYVGPYFRGAAGFYVATGFNKWGMTSSLVAAGLLTDLILGRDNPYTPVFSPSRGILRPQLAVNVLESLLGLLTPTVPRCPHMGCALKYNAAEHSWDCPCHGSRFGEDGSLIDNPASGGKQGM